MKFKGIKERARVSLKKNYIITVLICVTGMITLSLYSATNSIISKGIESFSNLFTYGVFLPNREYFLFKEYQEKQQIELEDIEKIEKEENEKSLSEKYRVTDGFFKPLLDFLDHEWQPLYDNITNIARAISPQYYVIVTGVVSIRHVLCVSIFFSQSIKSGL